MKAWMKQSEGSTRRPAVTSRRLGVVAGIGLALGAASAAAEELALEIGYMPILPVAQAFVALEEGWVAEAGVDATLTSFQNGPAMVQALLAGQLDVAHLGIGPAMVARGRGEAIKVVAASIQEQISFIAIGPLGEAFADPDADPAETFRAFAEAEGRKPVIATFPQGSVPETVLQHWLRKEIEVDPESLEIIHQGAAQVQQALLTGAVDAAAILEPIVTIAQERAETPTIVARGSEMFPGQPGAVLVVREELIAEHPGVVAALVDAHARATVVLRGEPERAAPAVQKFVAGGRLPAEVVSAALASARPNWVSDPNAIRAGATAMRDFQAETGTLRAPVDIDALIESRFHDAVN